MHLPDIDKTIIIFRMIRQKDESGISGTGEVLRGIRLPRTGWIICEWCSNFKTVASTVQFASWTEFKNVHCDSHANNLTILQQFYGYDEDGNAIWFRIKNINELYTEEELKELEKLEKELLSEDTKTSAKKKK